MPSKNPGPTPEDWALSFGPVPSRRLGRSIGVNTVPCKTCTYSCVYCQLGRTRRTSIERRVYRDIDAIVASVRDLVERASPGPDYITFIGCGEPTLAANLGEVFSRINDIADCRKALLTNGSLLWDPALREEVSRFDVVMPTVSACNETMYRRLHRPHPALPYEKVISGIREFARQFSGELWVEVMLVRGVNDDEQSLKGIGGIIETLDADRVHLTAPTRPPAERWVKCPTRESIELAMRIIPGTIDTTMDEEGQFGVGSRTAIEDLVRIMEVHPMSEEQILDALMSAGLTHEDSMATMQRLCDDPRITRIEHRGKTFYRTRG